MSTSQAFPIQASLPAKPATATVSTATDDTSIDSKGVFNGVLNVELDSAHETGPELKKGLTEQLSDLSLPLDGNSLPTAINNQLQADIAGLDGEISDLLGLDNGVIGIQGFATPTNSVDLKSIGSGELGKGANHSLQSAHATLSNTIRFVSNTPSTSGKPSNANVTGPVLPFADIGSDGETQAVTQFKNSLSLQKIFTPISRQTEVGIEAGQIGRVIEQFSEVKQKPVLAPTLSTVLPASPLSDTGTTATTTTTQLNIDVPVQDQRWQKAFSQRVVWSVGNVQSAQLRIHPAELGRIDIQINVENDKANVVFTAQQGVVKDAIEQALPRLREMLAEQGVELDNADIFHEDLNQQHSSAEKGSSQQQALENGLDANSDEEGQLDNSNVVSHVLINEDVVDFYV